MEVQTEELVSLAQRGNSVLDSKSSWLPLLKCLLKLNCHGMMIGYSNINYKSECYSCSKMPSRGAFSVHVLI